MTKSYWTDFQEILYGNYIFYVNFYLCFNIRLYRRVNTFSFNQISTYREMCLWRMFTSVSKYLFGGNMKILSLGRLKCPNFIYTEIYCFISLTWHFSSFQFCSFSFLLDFGYVSTVWHFVFHFILSLFRIHIECT